MNGCSDSTRQGSVIPASPPTRPDRLSAQHRVAALDERTHALDAAERADLRRILRDCGELAFFVGGRDFVRRAGPVEAVGFGQVVLRSAALRDECDKAK
jgi:hypothetical protein